MGSVKIMKPLSVQAPRPRVLFDVDHLHALPPLLDELGARRVMLVTTGGHASRAYAIAAALPLKDVPIFSGAKVHTPREVTETALSRMDEADALVSIGGGSAIGLGKALGLETGAVHVAIPTTYSGSEMTPVLGQTHNGLKTVLRDQRVVPNAVIYDVQLTLPLPVATSMASGFNALAHAFEGLYAPDRNHESTEAAQDAIAGLVSSLPLIAADPSDLEARSTALHAAHLAGRVLANQTMGLHHKLAHILGGAYNLPHAELHAVLLPHVVAFNEAVIPNIFSSAADALKHHSASSGLKNLAYVLELPSTLAQLGMPEDGIETTATALMQNPPPNPRPFSRDDILALLRNAFGPN